MPTLTPEAVSDKLFYEQAANDYCASLPLEHFMEHTDQYTQRKITDASFEVIRNRRPDILCFGELLVQYPQSGGVRDIGRVCPDNMVVIHRGEIFAGGSFNLPFEDAVPFMMLDYVSESNRRKDYVDNMRRYERDLRVPYYVLFEPAVGHLAVYQRTARGSFAAVPANDAGRYPVPELEVEIGLDDDWVRFWFRGEQVLLPNELDTQLRYAEDDLVRAEKTIEKQDARILAADEKLRAAEGELAALRAELARTRGNPPTA